MGNPMEIPGDFLMGLWIFNRVYFKLNDLSGIMGLWDK